MFICYTIPLPLTGKELIISFNSAWTRTGTRLYGRDGNYGVEWRGFGAYLEPRKRGWSITDDLLEDLVKGGPDKGFTGLGSGEADSSSDGIADSLLPSIDSATAGSPEGPNRRAA